MNGLSKTEVALLLCIVGYLVAMHTEAPTTEDLDRLKTFDSQLKQMLSRLMSASDDG